MCWMWMKCCGIWRQMWHWRTMTATWATPPITTISMNRMDASPLCLGIITIPLAVLAAAKWIFMSLPISPWAWAAADEATWKMQKPRQRQEKILWKNRQHRCRKAWNDLTTWKSRCRKAWNDQKAWAAAWAAAMKSPWWIHCFLRMSFLPSMKAIWQKSRKLISQRLI